MAFSTWLTKLAQKLDPDSQRNREFCLDEAIQKLQDVFSGTADITKTPHPTSQGEFRVVLKGLHAEAAPIMQTTVDTRCWKTLHDGLSEMALAFNQASAHDLAKKFKPYALLMARVAEKSEIKIPSQNMEFV